MFPRRGQQPDQPEPAAAAEPADEEPEELSWEDARLLMHRESSLLALGFSIEQVQQLPIRNADIAHTAEALLKKGASHDFVVHELREG